MPRAHPSRSSTTGCSTATACSRGSGSTRRRRFCWRAPAPPARVRALPRDRAALPRRRARRALPRGDRALRRAGRLPATDRHARAGAARRVGAHLPAPDDDPDRRHARALPRRALRARRRRDHLEPAARLSRQRPAADQVAELPHLGARGGRGAGTRRARGAALERRRRDLRVHGRQRVSRLARAGAHAAGVRRRARRHHARPRDRAAARRRHRWSRSGRSSSPTPGPPTRRS